LPPQPSKAPSSQCYIAQGHYCCSMLAGPRQVGNGLELVATKLRRQKGQRTLPYTYANDRSFLGGRGGNLSKRPPDPPSQHQQRASISAARWSSWRRSSAHAPSIAPSAPAHAGEDTPAPTTVAGFAPPPCPPSFITPTGQRFQKPSSGDRNGRESSVLAACHTLPCISRISRLHRKGLPLFLLQGTDMCQNNSRSAPPSLAAPERPVARQLLYENTRRQPLFALAIPEAPIPWPKHTELLLGDGSSSVCSACLPACPCTAQRPARCQLPDLARSAAALPEWEISKTPPQQHPCPPSLG
jgi:hypothetical protein